MTLPPSFWASPLPRALALPQRQPLPPPSHQSSFPPPLQLPTPHLQHPVILIQVHRTHKGLCGSQDRAHPERTSPLSPWMTGKYIGAVAPPVK